MTGKNQFKTQSKPHTFFDRKVIETGHSRVITVTKVIPKSWTYVRITHKAHLKDEILLSIVKLVGRDGDAQTQNSSSTDQQNP